MSIVRMPTKAKKPTKTPFTLFAPYEDDRKRSLRFDINALADFEQETGMGFAQLMQQKATFAAARALIWAGLKHEDRMLTIESVGTLLWQYMKDPESEDSRSINDVLLVVLQAGIEQGAFGRIKKDDKDEIEDVEDVEAVKPIRGPDPNEKVLEGQVVPIPNPTNSSSSDLPD